MSKLKKNKGFTLIELLVALAIVGIILLAFFRSVDSTNRMNAKNDRDIKALNIAQSEIENLRNQIKNGGQLDKIKIEDVIDILEIKNEILYEVEKSNENSNSIIYLKKIPEKQESKISENKDIDYDIEYTKSIDDKKFKIYLDLSKSEVDTKNSNIDTEMYLYTIYIKVVPVDNYFTKKETKIENVKILSRGTKVVLSNNNYLNYCLNKSKSYIKELDGIDTINLINQILEVSSKEIYDANDLSIMKNSSEKLIEYINNIRSNSNKEYLDKNQENLNGAEYYLEVVKSILYNYDKQNTNIDKTNLENIKGKLSDFKKESLVDGNDSVKKNIENLKAEIQNQKDSIDENLKSEIDNQLKIIDEYSTQFNSIILSDRIDKKIFTEGIDKISSNINENGINELSQCINDTIDIVIQFELNLKTYIYNNIPICDKISQDLISEINSYTNKIISKMNEFNEILIYAKAQLNKVNYIQFKN